uniref:Dynein light chain n=1 Tax=Rhipicephalus microplus TaxID=6941 RepID=A0A6M2CPS6_RHIMP
MRISNSVSTFDVLVADSSAADMDGELVLRYTEMSGSLLRDSLSVCTSACKKYPNSHEKAAKRIKQTMDRRHGSSWHVVVGASFGLEVTHEVRHILYLVCCSKFAVCLWRCS